MRSTWMRGTSLRWLICSYVEHDGGAPPPPVGADGGAVAGHRLHLPLGVMPRRVEALAREPGRGDVHGNESLRIVKVERVAQKMDEPLRGVRAAARHGPLLPRRCGARPDEQLPQRVNAGLIEPRLARRPKRDPLASPVMAPLYRMPDPAARRREALVRELRAALAAARCALRLAAAG